MAKDKWIQKANIKEGALRSKAKKSGLIKKGEKLSKSDLSKLESQAQKKGDTKTIRQVNLAKTFKKMGRKKG